MENNETPMIPKHQHQAEMMHMSRALKVVLIVSVSAFVAMVIMAYIFVSGYTSRTKDILNTLNHFRVVEVADAKEEQGFQ